MKAFKLYIYLILILINFYSCSNKHSEISLESHIINDIFLQILSNDVYYPIYPPPPLPQCLDTLGMIRIDSLKNKEYQDLISKIDTNRYVFSIEDSTALHVNSDIIIYKLKEEGLYGLFENPFNLYNCNIKNELPVEIIQIKNVGRYQLIKRSSLTTKKINFNREIFLNCNYYYFGNLIFSKLFFDSSDKLGFFIFDRNCGFECDRQYIIIIKKQDDKWLIYKKIAI